MRRHEVVQAKLCSMGVVQGYGSQCPAADMTKDKTRLLTAVGSHRQPEELRGERTGQLDVAWLDENGTIVAAFEVSLSTPISNGLNLLVDALVLNERCRGHLIVCDTKVRAARNMADREPYRQFSHRIEVIAASFFDACDARIGGVRVHESLGATPSGIHTSRHGSDSTEAVSDTKPAGGRRVRHFPMRMPPLRALRLAPIGG